MHASYESLSEKTDVSMCLKTCVHVLVFYMDHTSQGHGLGKENIFMFWSCFDLKVEQAYSGKGERDVAGS